MPRKTKKQKIKANTQTTAQNSFFSFTAQETVRIQKKVDVIDIKAQRHDIIKTAILGFVFFSAQMILFFLSKKFNW